MYFQGDHRSQYDAGSTARLRSMGCTPTTGSNAGRVQTGGAIDLSGDQVLSKLAVTEEQNPATPGWTLGDLSKALSRIAGMPRLVIRGTLWPTLVEMRRQGHVIVLQGDSDQFPSGCSGAFDGNHCILIHPDNRGDEWIIGDPICPDWTSQPESVVRNYAQKLWGEVITYGVFETPAAGGEGDMGLTLTDGGPENADITIRDGARYYPLDGSAGGTLPAVVKYTFASGYSGTLNKRLYVIGDEWAGVDVQDVTAKNVRPSAAPPAPAATTLTPGLYRVP